MLKDFDMTEDKTLGLFCLSLIEFFASYPDSRLTKLRAWGADEARSDFSSKISGFEIHLEKYLESVA